MPQSDERKEAQNMDKILEQIRSESLLEDEELGGPGQDDGHDPEKWCSLLRHQTRLADRAACSLAVDKLTGGEEEALIAGYRARLIRIGALAVAATESLDLVMKKRSESPDKEGDRAKRSQDRASRRFTK
jgi:hypothetical protein